MYSFTTSGDNVIIRDISNPNTLSQPVIATLDEASTECAWSYYGDYVEFIISGEKLSRARISNIIVDGVLCTSKNDLTTKIIAVLPNSGIVDSGGSGSSSASYLVYTALLSQSGTSAPVVTVLDNTLGGEPSSVYSAEGEFNLTLSGAFTDNKTFAIITPFSQEGSGGFAYAFQVNVNTIGIYSYLVDGLTPANGILSDASLEIRVYP